MYKKDKNKRDEGKLLLKKKKSLLIYRTILLNSFKLWQLKVFDALFMLHFFTCFKKLRRMRGKQNKKKFKNKTTVRILLDKKNYC